ncbi:MAG: type II CAAX endopeptidase family protein [Planctomycetota bacterium]
MNQPENSPPQQQPPHGQAGGVARHLGALALLVPAPTIGVVTALFLLPGTAIGMTTQMAMKGWILVLPVAWLILIAKTRPRLPAFRGRASHPGWWAGLATGIAIFAVIVGLWELAGPRLVDTTVFAEKIASVGLTSPAYYLLFAAGITLFNALMEEYVWRWFVYERLRDTLLEWFGQAARKWVVPGAVVLAALFFTLHHTIALSLYFDPLANFLASLGVFIGGITWSIIYLKTRNIYGCYLSHIFANVAMFYVGYQIAFG